jgi:hypothetical protein
MMYVLIILTGVGSYTGSSTAEFNSKAACEAAVVAMEKQNPKVGESLMLLGYVCQNDHVFYRVLPRLPQQQGL